MNIGIVVSIATVFFVLLTGVVVVFGKRIVNKSGASGIGLWNYSILHQVQTAKMELECALQAFPAAVSVGALDDLPAHAVHALAESVGDSVDEEVEYLLQPFADHPGHPDRRRKAGLAGLVRERPEKRLALRPALAAARPAQEFPHAPHRRRLGRAEAAPPDEALPFVRKVLEAVEPAELGTLQRRPLIIPEGP